MRCWLAILLLAVVLVCRLSHSGILWVEEAYPLAAAAEMLRGKVLYRDIWFDKPPLYALLYLLWGASDGMVLRVAGALFVAAGCVMLAGFARDVWGAREAALAGLLLAWFLTFGLPSAVMALAPDLLLIVPHIAAIWAAWRGRPLWSGVAAGVGLLCNAKALFVLAACLIFNGRAAGWLIVGAAIPSGCAVAVLAALGALPAYWDQVWRWGWLYSRDSFVGNPLATGVLRTLNWAGFQVTSVLAAGWFFRRERSTFSAKVLGWLVISLAAVAAGARFFPRYYFQLLPPLLLAASRGLTLLPATPRWALLALLLIPLVRFGPRYVILAGELQRGAPSEWSDTALNRDSQAAASVVRGLAKPGDTLLVWGYRPDVFVYSGLGAGTRFLDSQPLTGVLADRHLVQSAPTAPEWAARHRAELLRMSPSFIVDGLGLLNPELAIARYVDLKPLLANYRQAGRTPMSLIYVRNR